MKFAFFGWCFVNSRVILFGYLGYFSIILWLNMQSFFCMYSTGTGGCTLCKIFFTCKCKVLYGIFGVGCTVFAENCCGHPDCIVEPEPCYRVQTKV